MMIFQWCKTQILTQLILIYLEIVYTRDGRSLIRLTKRFSCNRLFDCSLSAANFALLFDAITACSVE